MIAIDEAVKCIKTDLAAGVVNRQALESDRTTLEDLKKVARATTNLYRQDER